MSATNNKKTNFQNEGINSGKPQNMKIVIVGGVAGGATAAARIRRLDELAEIVVFERSGYISYANCGLPYYIGGVIEAPEDLTLQTPESFFSRFRIQIPNLLLWLAAVSSVWKWQRTFGNWELM